VDKYIGDAVMAVFNHPHEDEAYIRHAAMAGLAMTRACQRLAEVEKGDKSDIQFRVGIHYGEAIVGNIGAVERLEYTVIGDAVNVASRMTGLGDGGEVILPQTAFKRIGDGFGFASIGRKTIKGIQKPMNCGRLVADSEKMRVNLEHAVTLAMDLTVSAESQSAVTPEGENAVESEHG